MKRRSKVRATAAKTRRSKSARLKRQSVPDDAARLASHVAGEESEIARLTRERNEAREHRRRPQRCSRSSQPLPVILSRYLQQFWREQSAFAAPHLEISTAETATRCNS